MSYFSDQILKSRSPNTTKDFGDRFIPKRSFLDISLIHHEFSFNNEEFNPGRDILCQEVNTSHSSTYQENLRNVFLSNSQKYTRILPLYVHKQSKQQPLEKTIHWPVHPRKKRCITTPEIVLDLPHFTNNLLTNLLDWGSTDFIAAGIARSVYLWHAPTNKRQELKISNRGVFGLNCIKWHPNGKIIAWASLFGQFEMIDITTEKIIGVAKNMCHQNCYINVMDFHPLQHSLALGCSKGTITKLSPDLSSKTCCQLHRGDILTMLFSCYGTYLASSGYDKLVYAARSSEVIFSIKLDSYCRGMAWHPWKESYLVLGCVDGKMRLHNVASNQTLAVYNPNIEYSSAILCLSFSKKTGELVTSHRINTETNCTQLNVLASFDRVVDRMHGRLGTIFYLKWNPDGTKLATAGSDEIIHIWNYLPKIKKQERNKNGAKDIKNKFGTVKNLESELQHSNIFGSLIR